MFSFFPKNKNVSAVLILSAAAALSGCASTDTGRQRIEEEIARATAEADRELDAVFSRVRRQEELLEEIRHAPVRNGYKYLPAQEQMVQLNDLRPLSHESVMQIVKEGTDHRIPSNLTGTHTDNTGAPTIPLRPEYIPSPTTSAHTQSSHGFIDFVGRTKTTPTAVSNKTSKTVSPFRPARHKGYPGIQALLAKKKNATGKNSSSRNLLQRSAGIPAGKEMSLTEMLQKAAKNIGFTFILNGSDRAYPAKLSKRNSSVLELLKHIDSSELNNKTEIKVNTQAKTISLEYK